MSRTEQGSRFPFKVTVDKEYATDDLYVKIYFQRPIKEVEQRQIKEQLDIISDNLQNNYESMAWIDDWYEWSTDKNWVEIYLDAADLDRVDPEDINCPFHRLLTMLAGLPIKEVKIGTGYER